MMEENILIEKNRQTTICVSWYNKMHVTNGKLGLKSLCAHMCQNKNVYLFEKYIHLVIKHS